MGDEIYLPFHEEAWAIGRELIIPITLHVVGTSGMQPSLSMDVDCMMTADMFTQMRSTIALQRMIANEKARRGRTDLFRT